MNSPCKTAFIESHDRDLQPFRFVQQIEESGLLYKMPHYAVFPALLSTLSLGYHVTVIRLSDRR